MKKFETISDDYLKEQQTLHQNPNYGVASLGFAPTVATLMQELGAKSVSDYGAGKKRLQEALEADESPVKGTFEYFPYDPAFPEYGKPEPADLVCCIDVLEHIEPEYLDAVLQDLSKIVVKHGFFSVHTGPAAKQLSDGRNAHLIQEEARWWLPRLCEYFNIEVVSGHRNMGRGFFVVVTPIEATENGT